MDTPSDTTPGFETRESGPESSLTPATAGPSRPAIRFAALKLTNLAVAAGGATCAIDDPDCVTPTESATAEDCPE